MNGSLFFPSQISFVGIDECTDVTELLALSEYGMARGLLIEFGVLFCGLNDLEGNNRYPSLSFMKNLSGAGLNLSLHLCGKHAGSFLNSGSFNDVKDFLSEDLFNSFQRIQINCVGRKSTNTLINIPDKEIIIQTNINEKHSRNRFEYYLNNKECKNIVFLSDASGGKGIVGNYQCYGTPWQGYAGGITPENVSDVIAEINSMIDIHNCKYWIDLESGCRENDWFSVDKCKKLIDNIIIMKESYL